MLLNHVADLVAQHHGQLGLVVDMGQHAGRQVDPAVRQRGRVRVDVLYDPEREGGRCRGVRRDEALAERTDVALDQGIGVFARYHCLGIAVRQGLELHQQFLALFRLFRGLLLGLEVRLICCCCCLDWFWANEVGTHIVPTSAAASASTRSCMGVFLSLR